MFADFRLTGANVYDGQANLTNLAEGIHNVTVCFVGPIRTDCPLYQTNYYNGSIMSSTTQFSVLASSSTSPSPRQQTLVEPAQTPVRLQVEDFAAVIIPASMIILAIVAVGLMVYYRRKL